MSDFLNDAGFWKFLSTFIGWFLAYVVLWIVSRFLLVKKDALERAVELLRRSDEELEYLASRCSDNSLPLLSDAVKQLRLVKKRLLKAEKMISIYQYDHNDMMDLIGIRGGIIAAAKLCDTLVLAIQDEKNKSAISTVNKMRKACQESISSINEIAKSQARKKMLEV